MTFINDSDHFDQHFLKDKNVINTFIKEAKLKPTDIIVEVGPGKGVISNLIAKKVNKLYCIELDIRLKPYLDKLTKNNRNVEIIYGSALNIKIPECTKIITSLPYSIIEPFINKLIKCKFDEVLMITGEKYATSVILEKNTMLSLLTNCYFTSEKIIDITPNSFEPAPRVMSSIIRLKPIEKHEIKTFNKLFFRYMFYFKNKKIKNALCESLIRVYEDYFNEQLTKKNCNKYIEELNIDQEILEIKFENCSNIMLEILIEKILLLENKLLKNHE